MRAIIYIGLTTTKHPSCIFDENKFQGREHRAKLTSRPKVPSTARILLQSGIQTKYS
jgi:hypothetical protein